MGMPERSEALIQSFGRRYVTVLVVVAGLLLVDQAVLQPLLIHLNLYAPVINLAGRQRMLSQRLTKGSLAVARAPQDAAVWSQELRVSLTDWTRVHRGLQEGDAELDLPGTSTPAIRAAFAKLDPDVVGMTECVERILADPRAADPLVPDMLRHEKAYLSVMDEIVRMFQEEARARGHQLRILAGIVTASAIGLMTGLYGLVLAPASRLIRDQVLRLAKSEQELREARDALEIRVDERTRELSEANASLEREHEEKEEAQTRTRELQEQLAHAARVTSLGQLATGIAHEINQPLGAITNYAEALSVLTSKPTVVPEEIQSISGRLRDAAIRAGRIVSRMRNFVRSRSAPRGPESIQGLVREVVALCESDLRENGVRVDLQLDPAEDRLVLVDSIQIQQVLVNLVRNATQAMSGVPAEERRLSLRTRCLDDTVAVEVEDTGAGLPLSVLQAEFQPFHSTKADGMGLGLSICRTILETHHGGLTARNIEPRGARLTFTLPVAHVDSGNDHSDRLCCR